MDLMTHHLVPWVLKWTKYVHTHTLLHPKGPHTKGGGPTPQWDITQHQGVSPDAPLPLHRLSFGHMQGNTLGSNPMC